MNRRLFLSSALAVGTLAAVSKLSPAAAPFWQNDNHRSSKGIKKVTRTNEEWKRLLTPEQYNITRERGTEAPFSSPLNDIHESGVFQCVACDLPLFSSKAKFDSGTGWPSFYEPIAKENVQEEVDNSLLEARTEVLCARCDSHIGHVFPDGPRPTGLRYCMNGAALKFVKGK
jgi:peptide-methionine (R)-S-oxide reductase